jgi:hypothetical protein
MGEPDRFQDKFFNSDETTAHTQDLRGRMGYRCCSLRTWLEGIWGSEVESDGLPSSIILMIN